MKVRGSGGSAGRSRSPEDEFRIFLARTVGPRAKGRCSYPVEPACPERPCKAHSIQNGAILASLAEDGHVIAVRFALGGAEPEVIFGRVGRNVATTFTGLCAWHDAELFAPIHRRPLDLRDREQMLLLAYRSVMRDVHASRVSAEKIGRALEERRRLGLPSSRSRRRAPSTRWSMCWRWRRPRPRRRNASIEPTSPATSGPSSTRWRAPPSPPGLAVSSLIGMGDSAFTGRALHAAFNVFHYEGRHVAVLSSRRPARQAAQNLGFVLKGTIGVERFRAVPRLVLKNCENLVLRPSLFRSLGRRQRRVMSEYFEKTTFAPHYGPLQAFPFPGIVRETDVDKLNLFEAVHA